LTVAARTSNGCSKCESHPIYQLYQRRPPRFSKSTTSRRPHKIRGDLTPSLFSAVNCKTKHRGSHAWSVRTSQGQQQRLEVVYCSQLQNPTWLNRRPWNPTAIAKEDDCHPAATCAARLQGNLADSARFTAPSGFSSITCFPRKLATPPLSSRKLQVKNSVAYHKCCSNRTGGSPASGSRTRPHAFAFACNAICSF
jgi:hypothetical protein